ncbi:MAG: SEL1-like repeat protein [Candidatus Competibacter sp.]|nr:SEL1-like repeat protein [Candidatus Competibacter sp.]
MFFSLIGGYHLAAVRGNASAQYHLGMMYAAGLGAMKNEAQAVDWFHRAAVQGYAQAQYQLGRMYVAGRGVARDAAQAARWFHEAALRGHASAQYQLGLLYAAGRGVAQDEAQAMAWFRQAADQGDAQAQYQLGLLYDQGLGAPQDYRAAARWYRQAADQGDADAQYHLGVLYDDGRGVARDAAQAQLWYRQAADRGDVNARYRLGMIENRQRLVIRALNDATRSGRYAEVEPLFQQALAKRQENPPEKPWVDTDLLVILNNLALLYLNTGRHTEAEPLLRRALAILVDEPGLVSDPGLLAPILRSLPTAYEDLPLVNYHDKLIFIDVQLLAGTLTNLAFLYQNTHRYAEAEPLLQQALAIWVKVLALPYMWQTRPGELVLLHGDFDSEVKAGQGIPPLPGLAYSLHLLALVYGETHRRAEAERLLQQALAIWEQQGGPEHPNVAASLASLAALYLAAGRYLEAEPLYRRALRIAHAAGVPVLLWQTQYGYATLLRAMQRPDAAIFFGKQAVNTLQALRTQLTPTDRAQSAFVTRVAYVYTALADWLRDAGRLPEAQEVLDLLGEDDYFQYVRPDPGAARMAAFSAAETRAAERYRTAGAGLARLAAEREALRVLAIRGFDQDARLARLNPQWTVAQQAFERVVQACGKGVEGEGANDRLLPRPVTPRATPPR